MAENLDEASVDAPEASEEKKERIDLSVEIAEAGPCKKHLTVTVPRQEIERFFDNEFSDLVKSANVPGFRPGKTPRKLIERRYRKDISDQVKATLLMQSLEQIGEEEKIEPLSEPDIDISNIELPEEGDFIYEFDVEVAPEFKTPEYKGLKLQRPVKEFTDEDVERELQSFRRRHGQLKPKDGPVAIGDYVVADIRFTDGDDVLGEVDESTIRVDEHLYFRDGKIDDFGKQIEKAEAGDAREMTTTLSESVGRPDYAGKQVTAVFVIKEVKELEVPDLDQAFFDLIGVSDEGELRDALRANMQQRLSYRQFERARDQAIEQLLEQTELELPQDLLRRQADRVLMRRAIELQSHGFSEDEIRAQENQLRQDALATAERSLKQQFILQRIAEQEGIKVNESDLEDEVRAIAQRTGDSVRRIRARIEKEQQWDAVGLQVLEGKAIQAILSKAELADVPYEEEELRSSGLDESAVSESAAEPAGEEPAEQPTE
jgi:trigger factor